jgi:formate-dependent nitrite reductase cytochrome c552 subunit
MPTLIVALVAACAYRSRGADQPATQPAKPADNSYCLTCHLNLGDEKLADRHKKAGVGCATCHGPSDKHSSDENGIIAPDVIFAKDRITSACASCHKLAQLDQDAAHDLFLSSKAEGPFKYCTSCHGKHTIPVRTRRWDKVTRQLIEDDGVRMVDDSANKKK